MKFVIKKALTDCKKDLEFCDKFYAVWKSTSHFSATCWLRRAVRDPHRHAIEQASRRWRRTRCKILISTQILRQQRTYYKVDVDLRE